MLLWSTIGVIASPDFHALVQVVSEFMIFFFNMPIT